MAVDYKKLWNELINELMYLINQEVKEIHPQIILEFMSFMRQREEFLPPQAAHEKPEEPGE